MSVARRGCPWENGYAERLIRTLKEEEVHLNEYQDITEARLSIGHFITQVYNLKRLHSALGYLTPLEFQQEKLA
ncbi:MAG: integrase core domain-containing protein [Candidatus Poribacteria bacterium]|nr:integrase core domain-containing protein [Candidatus Poribacteria bacterium]